MPPDAEENIKKRFMLLKYKNESAAIPVKTTPVCFMKIKDDAKNIRKTNGTREFSLRDLKRNNTVRDVKSINNASTFARSNHKPVDM